MVMQDRAVYWAGMWGVIGLLTTVTVAHAEQPSPPVEPTSAPLLTPPLMQPSAQPPAVQTKSIPAIAAPSASPLLQLPSAPLPGESSTFVTPSLTPEPIPPVPAQSAPLMSPEPELPAPDRAPPLYIHEQPVRLEIKLSRRQVTLYQGDAVVKRYPIAVGRTGWETPKGTYKVEQMFRNPTWVHPLKAGVVIPGGDPENPLGRFWIGFWTDGKNWIGFHGTDNPGSVGTAASHGCIRMYNKDIEEMFQKVNLGTEVRVIN